jgi:hypothetical protein
MRKRKAANTHRETKEARYLRCNSKGKLIMICLWWIPYNENAK